MHPYSTVHELYAGGIAGGEDGVEVCVAERGGLLEQQVLATRCGGGGPAHVDAGGERDVHGVDVRPGRRGGPRRSRGRMPSPGRPLSAAKRRAFSSERLPTAATAAPGASSMARETLSAMVAQPRMPNRTGRCSGVAADDMAAAGVGRVSVCGVLSYCPSSLWIRTGSGELSMC
jgi:hypothetical protein